MISELYLINEIVAKFSQSRYMCTSFVLQISALSGLHTQKMDTYTATSCPQILLLYSHAYMQVSKSLVYTWLEDVPV